MRAVLWLTAFIAFQSCANDGVGQRGLGGVIVLGKTNEVSMRKEVLEISANQVSVEYEFVNEGNVEVTLPVVFPLPPYSAIQPSNSWAGQPRGFKVLIDGAESPFVTHLRAIAQLGKSGKEDVTEKIRRTGLTPEQIAHFPGAFPDNDISPFSPTVKKATRINQKQMAILRKLKLVADGPSGETDYPIWDAVVTYSWNVSFPPGKPVRVAHVYTPFRAGGANASLSSYEVENLRTRFCADDAYISKVRQALKRQAQLTREGRSIVYGMAGTVVDYILTTANTWKGPIRDFTLRLKKSAPEEIISLCFPGDFKKIDALTLESHISDFVPGHDLSIRFINPMLGDGDARSAVYRGGPESDQSAPTLH